MTMAPSNSELCPILSRQEGFPDNGFTDVGCNEQPEIDSRTKAIVFLK